MHQAVFMFSLSVGELVYLGNFLFHTNERFSFVRKCGSVSVGKTEHVVP